MARKELKMYFQGQTNHVRLLVYLSLVTSSCGKTHVILSGSALWDYKGERSLDPILSYFAPYSQYTFLYTFTCVLSFPLILENLGFFRGGMSFIDCLGYMHSGSLRNTKMDDKIWPSCISAKPGRYLFSLTVKVNGLSEFSDSST